MRWPLRNQILLPLVVVAVSTVALVGGLSAWLAARATRERIEHQLQGVVDVLAKAQFPLSTPVLRQMTDLSGAEFVLTDQAGRLLGTSLSQPPPKLPAVIGSAGSEQIALRHTVSLEGRGYFHTSLQIPPQADDAAPGVLHILLPQDEYRSAVRSAMIPPLLVGLVSVAAVAAVAQWIAGRIGRTTSRLGADVERLASGDFGEVQLPKRDDELRDLAVAINRTAVRLAEYEREVRRNEQARTMALLGAGLAHEMRNAATGCRMAIDLHRETNCGQPEEESLSVAKRQLRLMETQLQRFLKSSKGPPSVAMKRVDLRELIEELLPLLGPAARHAGVELRWTPPDEPLLVEADAEALRQVVLNLMLNAIEAAQAPTIDRAAGPIVWLDLAAREDGRAELVVGDDGPGPDACMKDSLFEPFVSTKSEGVGLGLTVAKQVVEAHNGRIVWKRDGGRTEFHVELPLARQGVVRV